MYLKYNWAACCSLSYWAWNSYHVIYSTPEGYADGSSFAVCFVVRPLLFVLWFDAGHYCLLNRLFRRRSKKTSKLCVTGLCVGNSPGPVNSPHKWPVTRKMFPFDDVIMKRIKVKKIKTVCIFHGIIYVWKPIIFTLSRLIKGMLSFWITDTCQHFVWDLMKCWTQIYNQVANL